MHIYQSQENRTFRGSTDPDLLIAVANMLSCAVFVWPSLASRLTLASPNLTTSNSPAQLAAAAACPSFWERTVTAFGGMAETELFLEWDFTFGQRERVSAIVDDPKKKQSPI